MDLDEINKLVTKQELDWKAAISLQIKSLQDALKLEKDKNNVLEPQFFQLKNDFKYNLKLLEDRDVELKTLEENLQQVKISHSALLSEVSDLKILVDNYKTKLENEEKLRLESDRSYRQLLIQSKRDLDLLNADKIRIEENMNGEIDKRQRDLQFEVFQLQNELESQKLELTHDCEEMLMNKDKDTKKMIDELDKKRTEHQMKAKLLQIELNFANEKIKKSEIDTKENEKVISDLKNKLQEVEWDLSDSTSLKNQRILDLEKQLEDIKTKSKKKEADFIERRNKLDEDIKIKQIKLTSSEQLLSDTENLLRAEIRKLETRVEASELETKKVLWDQTESKKKFEMKLKSKEVKEEELDKRLKKFVENSHQKQLCFETEISALKQNQVLLENEKNRLLEVIERLQNEVSEHKFEEDLKKGNISVHQNKVSGQQLIDSGDGFIQSKSDLQSPNLDLQNLKAQNQNLKLVIKQMTSDMKAMLTKKTQQKQDQYIASLEDKVAQLDAEVKSLQQVDTANQVLVSSQHPTLQDHLKALTKKIVELEAEKTDLCSKLTKLQSTLQHQKEMTSRSEQQHLQTASKLHQAEIQATSIKHRFRQAQIKHERQVTALSAQLIEVQTEADEYYNGGVLQSLREIELTDEISEMKIEKASKQPWIKDHLQAKLIHDLKEEISDLKKRLAALCLQSQFGSGGSSDVVVSLLRQRLEETTNELKSLRKTNTALLESSNQMRSRLLHHKDFQTSDVHIDKGNEMEEMEKLQYDLTRKELEFAQRKSKLEEEATIPTKQIFSKQLLKTSSNDSMSGLWKVLDDGCSIGSEDQKVDDKPPLKAPIKKIQKKMKKTRIRNYNVKNDS